MNDSTCNNLFPELFKYRIIDFQYKYDIDEIDETYLDLVFEHNNDIVSLRFYSPVQIKLNGAFHPQQGGGLQIRDVKSKQLDNIGVQVNNFEPSEGNFEFYARAVEQLN